VVTGSVTLNWVTISSLATAVGTLVLAVATFASVRSANHVARVAERSFRVALRPILATSRLDDPEQRIMFVDRHWVTLRGGQAAVEVEDSVVYLAMQVRNVGNGIAVIEGWYPYDQTRTGSDPWPDVHEFRNQTRSLWIPPGDVAFWQGALRDASEELHDRVIDGFRNGAMSLDLLYRDHEGGWTTISRFSLIRDDDGVHWWASLGTHHTLDEAAPASQW
jgi:hypothetical protein